MTIAWPFAGSLLAGPLCSSGPWPYTIWARCCDVRPRFRVKQTIRSSCRAIARNGRILVCADRPLEELPGRGVRLRLQTWHRIYLPGDAPAPHGVLLCVRDEPEALATAADLSLTLPARLFTMYLRTSAEAGGELRIEVGGGMLLDFCATD